MGGGCGGFKTCQEAWEDCQNKAPIDCTFGSPSKCYTCYEICNGGNNMPYECKRCGFK